MRRPVSFTARVSALLIAVALIATACGRSERDPGSDTAAGTVARDTGMAGMDHSAMTANRGPAKDADHEFLRMMSDHHEGLIEMASAAMNKGSTPQVQGDAHQLHTKQEQEQTQMVDVIRSAYGETLQPMAMPTDKAMNDTLQAKAGVDYDQTFYRMIVKHHQEGIKMMDEYAPRVQRADVRQMIDKMRTDQQREIQQLSAKMK